VRGIAHSTQVERALRARFRLWIQSCDGSGSFGFNFFTGPGGGAEVGGVSLQIRRDTRLPVGYARNLQ